MLTVVIVLPMYLTQIQLILLHGSCSLQSNDYCHHIVHIGSMLAILAALYHRIGVCSAKLHDYAFCLLGQHMMQYYLFCVVRWFVNHRL